MNSPSLVILKYVTVFCLFSQGFCTDSVSRKTPQGVPSLSRHDEAATKTLL